MRQRLIRAVGYGRRVTGRYRMRGRMPFSAILIFACVVATLFFTRTGIVSHHERAAPPRLPQTLQPPGVPSLPGPEHDRYDAAERMVAQGQWRAAQDEYLRILLTNPNDTRAMQGLVAVERRSANDDAAALRRRAEVFRQALSGSTVPPGYGMEQLQLLYVANLMGAAQADAERMAKAIAPRSWTPAERRIERAPAQPPAMTLPAQKNRTPGVPATPGQSPSRSRAAAPAEAIPQLQPYYFPATVTPSPATKPPSRPAPSPRAPGAPTAPAQFVALERPLPERSAGTLRNVDCGNATLGIDGGGSWRTFAVTSRTVIYAGTEKLGQFCALRSYVGSHVLVWGTRVGTRRTAARVSVAAVSASLMSAPKGGAEAAERDALRPPPSGRVSPSWSEAGDPVGASSSSGYVEESDRVGIITTKISTAALVVTRDGPRPMVITPRTRVIGLRTAFDAINRFDLVRVHGWRTSSGTLIADVIEVTRIPSALQVQQMALDAAYASVNGMPQWVGAAGIAAITGQPVGRGLDAGGGGGASVSAGGASVTGGGGASINGGGASVSAGGGASVNAGGASVTGGGASINGGGASISGGGGASVNAGGASVSGGGGAAVNGGGASASAGAGAAVNGGASASAGAGAAVSGGGASVKGGGGAAVNGGASVSGGASVQAGGASVSGGASVNAGGASVTGGAAKSGGTTAGGGASVSAAGVSVGVGSGASPGGGSGPDLSGNGKH